MLGQGFRENVPQLYTLPTLSSCRLRRIRLEYQRRRLHPVTPLTLTGIQDIPPCVFPGTLLRPTTALKREKLTNAVPNLILT